MTSFDAIIIGGGHNGLVCAVLLAKTGRKVLVLEAADEAGGAARTREFAPGFRASGVAHLVNRLHPDMVRALELERHGLAAATGSAIGSVALAPDGRHLALRGAYGETLDGDVDRSDRAAWTALRAQMLRHAGILKPMLGRRPPDLAGMKFSDAAALGRTALSLRRLGRDEMRDFLRMLLMNVADVLDDELGDDRLKGLAAFDAVLGSHLGPRSPTSYLGLLYRLTGETGGVAGAQSVPAGGMGAVIRAIGRAAEAAGVMIRTGAPVARVIVAGHRAAGVALADGEEIRGGTVVSAIDPVTTFTTLVGPRHLDTGFMRRAGNIRIEGDAARLLLALDAPPRFTGLSDADHRQRLVIAPSVDHVERAFNPAKYGEFSPAPAMEIVLPSLADPSLAPSGACVLSATVQYAPYTLREGWDSGKPRLLEAILSMLETSAPGLRKLVRHAELLVPPDLEREYGLRGGHWHHGELQADQMLLNRPLHGAEGYATPLDGLWLCGAGSHPGGGVSGAPGMNAARAIVDRGGK